MAAIVATPVPLEQIGKLKGPQFGSKGVACLATDGAHVYAGCRDHAIRVYDARTHKLLYALGAPAGPLGAAAETAVAAKPRQRASAANRSGRKVGMMMALPSLVNPLIK